MEGYLKIEDEYYQIEACTYPGIYTDIPDIPLVEEESDIRFHRTPKIPDEVMNHEWYYSKDFNEIIKDICIISSNELHYSDDDRCRYPYEDRVHFDLEIGIIFCLRTTKV